MLLVDTLEKRIELDVDLKSRIATSRDHKKLYHKRIYLDLIKKEDVVSFEKQRRVDEKWVMHSSLNVPRMEAHSKEPCLQNGIIAFQEVEVKLTSIIFSAHMEQ